MEQEDVIPLEKTFADALASSRIPAGMKEQAWCPTCPGWVDTKEYHPHATTTTRLVPINPPKLTRWFTFGQSHIHQHCSTTLDKDTVVKITHVDPRQVMIDSFGDQWSIEYDKMPDMSFFPKGVYIFKNGTFVKE